MKALKISVLAVIALMMSIGMVYAQEATTQININPSQPIGNAVIIGKLDGTEISLGNTVVTTQKWNLGIVSLVQTTTIGYWWPNGAIMSKDVTRDTYFRGLLVSSISERCIYDGTGKLMSPITVSTSTYFYDKNNRMTARNIINRHYDATRKLMSSEQINTTYTYNINGAQAGWVTNARFYDAKNKLVLSSTATMTNTYDASGWLKQEAGTYIERAPNGSILSYSKSTTDYAFGDNGSSYIIYSNYDANNRLCGKAADISLTKDGQTVKYRVSYDVDDTGSILHTHVYDANNNELGKLGGDGYKEPTNIITAILFPISDKVSLPIKITVNGDLTLNSNKTWDLSKFEINVSGSLNVMPTTNGYDIYSSGDMTIESDGPIDLSPYSIFVNGNLTINAKSTLTISGSLPMEATGALNITTGNGTVNVSDGDFVVQNPLPILPTDGNTTINVPFNGNTGLIVGGSNVTTGTTPIGGATLINSGSTAYVNPTATIDASELLSRKDIESTVVQNTGKTCPQLAGSKDPILPAQKK